MDQYIIEALLVDYVETPIANIPDGSKVSYYQGNDFKIGGFMIRKVLDENFIILSSNPQGDHLRWKVVLNDTRFFMKQN